MSARLDRALSELEALADGSGGAGLARFGIVTSDRVIGMSMKAIQALAKRLGRDHALALQLWESGIYEARMLACYVDDPAQVTPAQMDAWRAGFDNWATCDTACFVLFDRTPTPSAGSTRGPAATTSSAAAPPSPCWPAWPSMTRWPQTSPSSTG